jgi:hypothetical protein
LRKNEIRALVAVVLSEIFGNVLVSEDDSLKSVRSQANSVGRLRDN